MSRRELVRNGGRGIGVDPKDAAMKITAPLLAVTTVGALLCGACLAFGQPRVAPPTAVIRPADVSRWVTLGTTLHMRADTPQTPDEMRHVQIAPDAYDQFLRDGTFPDGARFAVTFHALKADGSGAAALYAEDAERFFGLEILDTHHPDGRRFYAYPPGAVSAQALAPGNSCAVCHKAHGTRQGTFAHYYPTIVSLGREHGAP